MPERRYKVLFLASWFPTAEEPNAGIFIKKHAQAIGRYASVAVLYISVERDLNRKYKVENNFEEDVHVFRAFFRESKVKIQIIRKLNNVIRRSKIALKGFKEFCKKFGKPDIAHVNVVLPGGRLAFFLNFFRKLPYIITEHWSGYTTFRDAYSKYSLRSKLWMRLVFKRAKAVTAVSRFLLRCMNQRGFGISSSYVIPNIVDIPPAHLSRPKETAPVRILTISSLVDKSKNISGLIDAFRLVVSSNPDTQLNIIGDGPDRKMLMARAGELQGDKIFFHGYIPNQKLWEFFSKAHFFVLNSNYETFSVATAEAILHGVPVIVTQCGGPEEFVTPEVGIIVKGWSKKSLVEGIEYMIRKYRKFNPQKLSKYAEELFNAEKIGMMYIKIYESILDNKGES